MSQAHNFQDLEETVEMVLQVINTNKDEIQLKLVRNEQQNFFDRHMETKKIVTQIIKDFGRSEEKVGQKLLDLEVQKKQARQELNILEEQLRQSVAKSQISHSELQILQGEIESLRHTDEELESLRHEVDEDTTEVIPSAIYMAQLYHKITKIKWEHDTEPHILKGVHYGADLATPIDIDTSVRARCDVSDQLWAFVSTEW